MNLRTATAFLTLVLAASGCVINGGSSSRADPGDIHLTWALGGRTCAQNPDIVEVQIVIPGERLENDGFYACAPNGVMGIQLHNFRGGNYSASVKALDVTGRVRFATSASFTVDGDVNVHLDLLPQDAWADLYWNLPPNSQFPNGSTCGEAGVEFMEVFVDSQPVIYQLESGAVLTIKVGDEYRPVVPCVAGQRQGGLRIELPTAGVHTLDLYAVDSTGYAYYELHDTLTAFAGEVAQAEFDLSWAVGAAYVDWDLYDVTLRTCAAAGVTQVAVQFEDAFGRFLYGDDIDTGDRHACDEYGADFEFLPPGDYRVHTAGFDRDGNLRYGSDLKNPARLQVRAGLFEFRDSNFALSELDRL